MIQCLSMIPGVSRSGATIVGAMLFGDPLAVPTMVGIASQTVKALPNSSSSKPIAPLGRISGAAKPAERGYSAANAIAGAGAGAAELRFSAS